MTILLVLSATTFCACSSSKKSKKNDNVVESQPLQTMELKYTPPPYPLGEVRNIQATGVVGLYGNSLFNDLVIVGEYSWYVIHNERNKLHSLQQRTVTVEGEETIIEIKFLHDLPSLYRRQLSNIKIISVE